jgi:hypothetical protein
MFDDDRYIDPHFKLSDLNFTFKAYKQDENRLYFKLNFTKPLKISSLAQQDILILHFKDRKLFYSQEINNTIDFAWQTISSDVKKQIPDNAATQNLKSAGEATAPIMNGILIGTFLMNFLFHGAM